MAQTGYTPIQLYYSSTTTNTPSAGNLANGELAINIADGKLFYKDSSGTVKVIAGTGGTGVVAGSNTQLQFNNSGVFGASANLTWNGSALGVTGTVAITGALTATADSTFSSTGAVTISKGTTAQRPTASSGMLRFNTTTSEFEGYNGTTWASVGGAAIVNDTTTATALYPLFASSTSGTATTLYTGNAKLLYTPSNGELQAGEMYANNGVLTHANQVTSNYTVPTNANVITVGPWTVASGASFTLPSGSRQVLL